MNGTQSDAQASNRVEEEAGRFADVAVSAPGSHADFELSKRAEGGWRLNILTNRGMHWSHANFVELVGEDCVLTLTQANSFLGQARKFGLTTHYIGPNGRTIL